MDEPVDADSSTGAGATGTSDSSPDVDGATVSPALRGADPLLAAPAPADDPLAILGTNNQLLNAGETEADHNLSAEVGLDGGRSNGFHSDSGHDSGSDDGITTSR